MKISLCSKHRLGENGPLFKVKNIERLKRYKKETNITKVKNYFFFGTQKTCGHVEKVKKVNRYKKNKEITLCCKNRLGKNGSLFKVKKIKRWTITMYKTKTTKR